MFIIEFLVKTDVINVKGFTGPFNSIKEAQDYIDIFLREHTCEIQPLIEPKKK
jgi:hypothetical protein